MNRNDLVNKLSYYLEDLNKKNYNEHEKADLIVSFVEELGMQPPRVEVDPVLLRYKNIWESNK